MRIEKKIIKRECEEKIASSQAMILTNYTGISAEDMTAFRSNLRGVNAKYSIVKNSVFKITAKEKGINCLDSYLDGPVGVAFVEDDSNIVAVAKAIKECDAITVKGGVLNGEGLDSVKIEELASLPSREVLISQVVGGLNSVIVNFVGVLRAQVSSVVTVLDAVKNKKENQ